MDPLLDEKIVHLISRNLPEFLENQIEIQAKREAYGPSRNEGLCFESVAAVDFMGGIEGTFYFCMDGYTRLKLLPKMAEWGRKNPGELLNADELYCEFTEKLTLASMGELVEAGISVRFAQPENLSRRLVGIDNKVYRQYMLIFFLKESEQKKYAGRATVVIRIKKFTDEPGEDRAD